ncbi:MAG: hypothetical protein LWX83_16585 [Anaerolineae bacterium]|nr:hypothetical protein [Anaerolineae bacterium]
MPSFVNRLQKINWFPALLLLATILPYLPFLPRLGFYWVDWQVIFLAQAKSPAVFWDYFLYDRPFSVWTYDVSLPLLGLNPLLWQIFTLLLRWLAGLGFYWTLNNLWKDKTWQVRWMAIVFVVFPGFMQQLVAMAYSQHFTTYALFTLSLAAMLTARNKPRFYWLFTALALVACLTHMLTMEYFTALELIRPLILFLLIFRENKNWASAIKHTFLQWLPYLLMVGFFLFWRFIYYPTLLPGTDQNMPGLLLRFSQKPLAVIIELSNLVIKEFLKINIFDWLNLISPEIVDLNARSFIFSIGMGLAGGALIAWLLNRISREQTGETPQKSYWIEALLLALAGFMLGGLPVWGSGRSSAVGMWSDRFTLGPLFGSAILLVLLLDWLLHERWKKFIVLGILTGLAFSLHIRTANQYMADWDNQRDYYWQLLWRAPGLKPNTAIIATRIPSGLLSKYSAGFIFNVLYDPTAAVKDVPYWYFTSNDIGGDVSSMQANAPIKYTQLRNMNFKGNTSQALVITRPSNERCLWVVSPYLRDEGVLTYDEEEITPLSSPAQILAESTKPVPLDVIGAEPARDWCYYFEKAELNNQYKKWDITLQLWNEAQALQLQPRSPAELTPFVLAFAQNGMWDKAQQIGEQMQQIAPDRQPTLNCALWTYIKQETPPSNERDVFLKSINYPGMCTP